MAATTFAAIAKRAGLTPAMMHYYFKDREHLLDCVVDEKIAPVIAAVWSPVDPGAAPEELMRGVVERLVAGIERMPWIPSAWMREVLNEGGLLRSRVLRKLPFDKVRILSEAVARAQAKGEIQADLDPVLIVFSMLGPGDDASGNGALFRRGLSSQGTEPAGHRPPHYGAAAAWTETACRAKAPAQQEMRSEEIDADAPPTKPLPPSWAQPSLLRSSPRDARIRPQTPIRATLKANSST